jgi:hypothetical protein
VCPSHHSNGISTLWLRYPFLSGYIYLHDQQIPDQRDEINLNKLTSCYFTMADDCSSLECVKWKAFVTVLCGFSHKAEAATSPPLATYNIHVIWVPLWFLTGLFLALVSWYPQLSNSCHHTLLLVQSLIPIIPRANHLCFAPLRHSVQKWLLQ